jgi:hypothetical protein
MVERKTALKWVLRKAREGIQYVEHAEGQGDKLLLQSASLLKELSQTNPPRLIARGRRGVVVRTALDGIKIEMLH